MLKPEQESIPDDLRLALEKLSEHDLTQGIKSRFANDPDRCETFGFSAAGLFFDFSKTHISKELMNRYLALADARDLQGARQALFSGEKINITEDRSVLHTLLRDTTNQGIEVKDPSVLLEATAAKAQFKQNVASIHQTISQREHPIKDIIHVGIGGSSLGTQLLFQALVRLEQEINIHFVANIDAHQLVSVLHACRPESTLVIGVSKTFSTAETLQNLNSIGRWFEQNGFDHYLNSFYAVSASRGNALEYGIPERNIIVFPQWVGGRYSVWSAVSLSAALLIGYERFQEFLAGAADMDKHFYRTDLEHNICFIAAALDHYTTNFLGSKSKAIFAYDYRLRSLVDYLQQLETESNGKDRRTNGLPVDQHTSPVIWGGVGTDVQHSVFQMLHQGTELMPAEFILVKKPDHDHLDHHLELLANGLAQPAALLAGQTLEQVALRNPEGLPELAKQAKIFSGERPSTTILLERLTPTALGALLAFYEHRTFCSGVFADINSFDQMGVELGKHLAKQVKPLLHDSRDPQAAGDETALDPSTRNLLRLIKQR